MRFLPECAITHRSATLLALVLVATALAGCISGDDDLDSAAAGASGALAALGCAADADTTNLTVVHFAADNAIELPAEDGTNSSIDVVLFPTDHTFDSGSTLCWVNDTEEEIEVMAMPQGLDDAPEWTLAAAPPPDPHAGHDMGGSDAGDGHDHAHDDGAASGTVFQFPVAAGAAAMQTLEYDGLLMMNSVQDPASMGIWTVVPNETKSYPVTINKVQVLADTEGETAAGETTEHVFDIAFPDLVTVKLTFSWDDSADDAEGGATTNNEDTFKVELLDPAGEVVKSTEKSGRKGDIIWNIDVENAAWPAEATGAGEEAAAENLYTERPPDETFVGAWTLKVTLVSGAGAVPDGSGALNKVSTDGTQAWSVKADFFHEFASVKGPGDGSATKLLKTDL